MTTQALCPSPVSIQHPPLDFQHLARITEGDRDFQRELLGVFVEDATQTLRQIEQALNYCACEQVTVLTQQLKGAARGIGAQRLAGLLDQFECFESDPWATLDGLAEALAAIPRA